MKNLTFVVCTALAVGILSIPSLINTIQGQTNMSNLTTPSMQNQTGAAAMQNQTTPTGANQTISKDIQTLMTLNIPEMKDKLMDAKESLVDGNTQEALTTISEIENQLLGLQNQPSFTKDIQQIKNSIGKADMNKVLDDLAKVQIDLIKAETEVFKAQSNSQIKATGEQNNNGADKNDDDGDNN